MDRCWCLALPENKGAKELSKTIFLLQRKHEGTLMASCNGSLKRVKRPFSIEVDFLLLYGKIVSMTTLCLLSSCFFSSSYLCICFFLVHTTLKSAFSSLVTERDKLRHTIDLQAPQPAQVMGLKAPYAPVSHSNSDFTFLYGYTNCSPLALTFPDWLYHPTGMSCWLSLLSPSGV